MITKGGTSFSALNGKVYLVIGVSKVNQTGAHNIVKHTFSSYGRLVVRHNNTISDPYSAVRGGLSNTPDEIYSVMSGGLSNEVSRNGSDTSGGYYNGGSGSYSTVSGGS